MLLAKTLLRVRNREGDPQPLAANPTQLAFERDRAARNIVLKARQMGITTWIAGRFFLKTITSRGVLTVLVAHTSESARMIFRIVQRFWENLDEEFREGPLKRGTANVRCMNFPALDSEFRVLSASDRNAGRGLTMQNLHCSEVARWPGNAAETLAGLRAALAPGGELVIESTPRGAYGSFYEEWSKAADPSSEESGDGRLVRHFFPWWMEPAYQASPATDLTPEEDGLVRRHSLTPEQIGFRRALESSFERNRSQEYAEDPETCFRATGDCCFDIEAIEKRLTQLGAPLSTRRGDTLQIYLPAQPGKRYLVAADSAGGDNHHGGNTGDFAAIQVIDLESGLQCAELQQKIRPDELARVSVELAKEYGNALLAVESNNHGATVLAYIAAVEFYDHIYRQGGKKGWLTTSASKPPMVARMGALLAHSPQLFLSRRLLAECRTFVALFGGRTGAANGAHDDCFMAMAVAQSVRAELLNHKKGA